MTDLIDTTIIVDYLRDNQRARDFIKRDFSNHRIPYVSVIPYVEIYAGARFDEEKNIVKLFKNLIIIQVDTEIGRHEGNYLNFYGKSHGVEMADALIAATAFIVGAKLVTLDKKHFPMTDIQVYTPY